MKETNVKFTLKPNRKPIEYFWISLYSGLGVLISIVITICIYLILVDLF